jgi:hypothetical protein
LHDQAGADRTVLSARWRHDSVFSIDELVPLTVVREREQLVGGH